MKTTRLQSTLVAAGLAAVLMLPYAAPTVCGVLGRMGGEMEMMADAATGSVRAPDSGGMCCTLNECGLPQVAPVAYFLSVLQQMAVVRAEQPASPSEHPNNALLPPIPPPQA